MTSLEREGGEKRLLRDIKEDFNFLPGPGPEDQQPTTNGVF